MYTLFLPLCTYKGNTEVQQYLVTDMPEDKVVRWYYSIKSTIGNEFASRHMVNVEDVLVDLISVQKADRPEAFIGANPHYTGFCRGGWAAWRQETLQNLGFSEDVIMDSSYKAPFTEEYNNIINTFMTQLGYSSDV